MKKLIYRTEEVAEYLGISLEDVEDLINNNELPAVGSNKSLVRHCDIMMFIGDVSSNEKNVQNALDKTPLQRSNHSYNKGSVNDLSEKEWSNMMNSGKKEHTPYFNQKRGQWCIALSLGKKEDGKRIRKIITADTEESVWKAYKEYLSQQIEIAPVPTNSRCVIEGIAAQMNLQTYSPQQDVLFSDHFKKYLKNMESSITNKTYSGYVQISQHIMRYFEGKRMYELTPQDFIDFLTMLSHKKTDQIANPRSKEYYSQGFLNKIYNLLRKFTKSCSDPYDVLYIGTMNYMQNVKKPRSNAIKTEGPTAYTNQEIASILNAVSGDLTIYCWIRILAETGVRPSEALALYWNDIDWENHTISITKTLGEISTPDLATGKMGTIKAIVKDLKNANSITYGVGNHCRVLPVSSDLLKHLKKLMQVAESDTVMRKGRIANGTTEMVFTSPSGKMWTYQDYNQKYNKALKKANIIPRGMNPYRFRHTVCTYYVQNGYDPKTIQILMGDATIDVIYNTYTNLKKEEIYQKGAIASNRIEDIGINITGIV